MRQHFLLSAKARTLSVIDVARMSDAEAESAFRAVRFAENEGKPYCPHCGVDAVYEFKKRAIFKCKGCEKQFSTTSGTLFASRKMSYRDILTAIALFVNGVNGHAALRLSRDLNCSYKTSFVLLHKLREVMGHLQTETMLTGEVEIDGLWIGGHIKPPNMKFEAKEVRRKRREAAAAGLPKRNEAKRYSIVTMKERRRGGRSRSLVFRREEEGIHAVGRYVHPKAVVITDRASHWNQLELRFPQTQQVNHSAGYVIDGVHINNLEAHHSRIRRGERGVYTHMAGPYLQSYADEFSWREDHRRVSNGQQFQMILGAAACAPASLQWRGFWQRRRSQPPEAA